MIVLPARVDGQWETVSFLALTHRIIVWEILVNIGSALCLLLDGTKPLPEPVLTYCQLNPQEQTFEILIASLFIEDNCISKCLQNGSHFIKAPICLLSDMQDIRNRPCLATVSKREISQITPDFHQILVMEMLNQPETKWKLLLCPWFPNSRCST